MAFDPLGCAKSALKPGPNGSLHFTPYGAAGSTYLIRSQLDADRIVSGIANFCATGGLLVAVLLAAFVLKSSAWPLVLMPLAVWMVVFVLWTRSVTRSLVKVA